jgi:hypothetical protein
MNLTPFNIGGKPFLTTVSVVFPIIIGHFFSMPLTTMTAICG